MFENKNNRTELQNLGEFGLIEHIKNQVQLTQSGSIKGIGDDAAVIDNGPGLTEVTTDLLLEGVHFDLSYCPLKHIGYKAVVVNISDVCAMNAIPKQITLGLGISNRFSLEAIEEFYEGVLLACERYGVDLVGGNTTSSQNGMVISITAIGIAPAQEIVYRNGAKENDLICFLSYEVNNEMIHNKPKPFRRGHKIIKQRLELLSAKHESTIEDNIKTEKFIFKDVF